MSTPNLLPCPFCGGANTQIKENGKIWAGTKWSEPCSVSVVHWCEPVPGQPSRMLERVGRDLDSAVSAWNTRYVHGAMISCHEPQPSYTVQTAAIDKERASIEPKARKQRS